MKILFGYAIILGFSTSFSNCYNFSTTVDPYHKVIYKFVKQVIADWNQNHQNDINDISIINLDNDTSLFHVVRKAVLTENPVLLPNCKSLNNTDFLNTEESSIFVVISKVTEELENYITGLHGCINSGFWTPLTNVLIIPPENVSNTNDIKYPTHVMVNLRTVNFIIPHVNGDKVVELFSADTLRKKLTKIKPPYNSSTYFGDPLADMKGYTYTLTFGRTDKNSIQLEIELLKTIVKKQKAKLYAKFSDILDLRDFRQDILKAKVDMFMNFGYYSGTMSSIQGHKTIPTYEINGYCALVPIVRSHELLLRFVVKPFSKKVWYLIFLYILIGAVIWQISTSKHKRTSLEMMHFIIDLASVFIQQSIKVRKGHFGLKIMLQIFIFMMIILGNVYQGVITSILMDARKHNELTSIQELMDTDFEFYGDQLFLQIMNESDTNWSFTNRTKSLKVWLHNSEYVNQYQKLMTVEPNNVLIVGCDTVTELLNTKINDDTRAYEVYYQFDQKILSYYENILLTRRSPFYEKLGELSLRIHESGIKQHWTTLIEMKNKLRNNDDTDASMLKLKEILPIFQVFSHGLDMACFTFLLEILWFLILKKLLRMILCRCVKNWMRWVQKYYNRKVSPRVQKD